LSELDHIHAPKPMQHAWESWTLLLAALRPVESLDPALEADVIDTLNRVADHLSTLPLDYAALGPEISDQLWRTQTLREWLDNPHLKKLLWCPAEGELSFTCIDAADALGMTLREYGGVVCASATFGPPEDFAEACGFRPSKSPQVADHAGISDPRFPGTEPNFAVVRATTPWRDDAYDVAVDARVDTSFQHRSRSYAITAATIARLHEAAHSSTNASSTSKAVAVFFPSYAYADTIARELDRMSPLRVALQPRIRDLATQSAWVEESLVFSDALFLVLGSSFAESIDLLGGRISHAMVVGPALPEVNAVQRARLAELSALGRAGAFRRVYQIPGMTKVNQALGRLVRAPGQRARVLLHCQRFLDASYGTLLAKDYQFGVNVLTDEDLDRWLSNSVASSA
jgi:DNA excision repair protein ERCC-2